jgi:hypothetical protein
MLFPTPTPSGATLKQKKKIGVKLINLSYFVTVIL